MPRSEQLPGARERCAALSNQGVQCSWRITRCRGPQRASPCGSRHANQLGSSASWRGRVSGFWLGPRVRSCCSTCRFFPLPTCLPDAAPPALAAGPAHATSGARWRAEPRRGRPLTRCSGRPCRTRLQALRRRACAPAVVLAGSPLRRDGVTCRWRTPAVRSSAPCASRGVHAGRLPCVAPANRLRGVGASSARRSGATLRHGPRFAWRDSPHPPAVTLPGPTHSWLDPNEPGAAQPRWTVIRQRALLSGLRTSYGLVAEHRVGVV